MSHTHTHTHTHTDTHTRARALLLSGPGGETAGCEVVWQQPWMCESSTDASWRFSRLMFMQGRHWSLLIWSVEALDLPLTGCWQPFSSVTHRYRPSLITPAEEKRERGERRRREDRGGKRRQKVRERGKRKKVRDQGVGKAKAGRELSRGVDKGREKEKPVQPASARDRRHESPGLPGCPLPCPSAGVSHPRARFCDWGSWLFEARHWQTEAV